MNQEEEKEKQKKIFSKKSRQRSHWHSINGKQWKEARSTSRPSQSCTEAVKHSRENKRCNGLFLSHISQTRRSKLQRILRTVEMERIIITLRIIIAFRNGGTLSLASNSSLSHRGRKWKERRILRKKERSTALIVLQGSTNVPRIKIHPLPPLYKPSRIFNARKRERNAFHVQQSGSSWLRFIFSSACSVNIIIGHRRNSSPDFLRAGRRKRVQISPSYSTLAPKYPGTSNIR